MKKRRKVARSDIRVRGSYTLPKWIDNWLRAQTLPTSRLVQAALVKTYGIKNPKDEI